MPAALVCVYYKVAADRCDAMIAAVREIQRSVAALPCAPEAELHLRSISFSSPLRAAVPTPSDAAMASTGECTLMETYRLSDVAGIEPLLSVLDAQSQRLAPMLTGSRHLELFTPCAS